MDHAASLKMTFRTHMNQLLNAADQGYCLCDIIRDDDGVPVDFRFVDTSPVFSALTGLVAPEGRTGMELLPELEQSWIEIYGRVAAGEEVRFQSTSAALGSRWFDVTAHPVEPAGRFALIFRDISDEREIDAEREDARTRAENLLIEFNHRVMNTLATITAIVRMEAQALDGAAAMAMERVQTRLSAVTTLYRALNRAQDLSSVPADKYLAEVATAVTNVMADRSRIKVDCRFTPAPLLPATAAPLAMLLNELMTNALKYAFPGDRRGTLSMRLSPQGDDLVLEVEDDGIGKAAAAEGADPDTVSSGVGASLIEAFVTQLQGSMEDRSGPTGTHIVVTFPNPQMAPDPAGD